MALIDRIEDTFPANNDVGVPLLSTITITFDRLMDETDLNDHFFVEGPDSDQFVGPGLTLLEFPDNTSQGEVDDFLRSPGYKGIVQGTTTFTTVSGTPSKTVLTFTPDKPLVPLTQYTAMLSDSLDDQGVTHTGLITFTFQAGSGSIEEVPAATSSSILKTTAQPGILTTSGALAVVKTTPVDHAIEQDPKLSVIEIEFNKALDGTSVPGKVSVVAEKATDHPNATAIANGDLAKVVTVSGRKITVSI
jgi:hypothetical protein